MTRRQFLHAASVGAVVNGAIPGVTDAARTHGSSLPTIQLPPQPSLGTHWENVFEKISSRCQPRMSFLDADATDPNTWAERARARLLAHLHYDPPACDPKPEILDRADRGTHFREYVRIQTAPDIRVSAYVLIPRNLDGPAPALVALHDHGGFYFWGKEKLVHIEPEHPALAAFKAKYYSGRSIADELAQRGFVVIVSDMLHWGERGLYLDADPERIRRRTAEVTLDDIRDFNARSWENEELMSRTALACGATWAGINIREDQRITDYLLTRPEVDPQRVGCLGLSLGAVRAIYLGAIHPAVRASVAVCWMAKYQMMTRDHVRNAIGFTKLVPGLYNDLDWPDLAGLHWPGSLMTINGLQDQLYPLEAARQGIDKIKQIYRKLGTTEKYEGVFFDGPHEFNAAMQDQAFAWLTAQLAQS